MNDIKDLFRIIRTLHVGSRYSQSQLLIL
jgi:hypothetical protein